MRIVVSILSVLLLACASAVGSALVLPGTGFEDNGNPLAPGAVDPYWIMDHNPVDDSTNAYFIAPGTGNWWGEYAPNTNAPVFQGSGWISTNPLNGYNGPAPYSFSMSFSLAGFDLNTVSLSGLWSIADTGTLSINGFLIDTLYEADKPWMAMHNFTVSDPAYFLQDINTITMTMTASDQYFEAARFEGTITGEVTGVPEPGTLLLMGTGIVGVCGALRRTLNK